MRKSLVYIIVFTTLFLFISCKSKKILIEGERATSTSHLIGLIENTQPSFTTLNASSATVEINMNGKKNNYPATLRMITDSVIVLSVYPFLGIEMGSVELYPDRWIIYDKMNRQYATDNYDYFSLAFGQKLNFKMLQSLFSANLFNVDGQSNDAKNYRFVPVDDGNEIIYESNDTRQIIRTSNYHTIENVTIDNKENYHLSISYDNYNINKNINYPRIIRISADMGENSIGLNFKIQKVSFDSEMKLSLTRPDRYTRVSADQYF